jgi:sugar phosphate isomerase/epimerase
MDACFHSVGLPDRDILSVVDAVAGAGYVAVELNAETLPWAPAHVDPATSAADRRRIVERCRLHGLAIPAVGAHVPMVGADAVDRAAAIAYVDGCTDLAVDVGAPVVHILSGPVAAGTRTDEAWRWFADAVARTSDYARARGRVLAVEAIAGHLFHGVDDYHRLTGDLPGVPFAVNFDPSHLIVQDEDPIRVVDELADRIVHVHMKDGSGRFPDFAFPPLGSGAIDFAALVAGLEASGYAGALSVEYEAQVFGFEASEDEILAHGIGFLRRLGVGYRPG